jgi:hypothetical protein
MAAMREWRWRTRSRLFSNWPGRAWRRRVHLLGGESKKPDCTCAWISMEGSRIAGVRHAWLGAGLPAKA